MDYAAVLRQYNRYGHGLSMREFREDEGYDYWKFCKLAREGQIELEAKSGGDRKPGFAEVSPDGSQSEKKRSGIGKLTIIHYFCSMALTV